MRRVFRIAFNALTVISLVLAILVAGLWVRSLGTWSAVWFDLKPGIIRIASGRGDLEVARTEYSSPDGYSSDGRLSAIERDVLQAYSPEDRGMGFGHFGFEGGGGMAVIWVPYWFIGLLAIVAPTTWVASRRRRHRLSGKCVCGYDLRATPDRCPECDRPALAHGN